MATNCRCCCRCCCCCCRTSACLLCMPVRSMLVAATIAAAAAAAASVSIIFHSFSFFPFALGASVAAAAKTSNHNHANFFHFFGNANCVCVCLCLCCTTLWALCALPLRQKCWSKKSEENNRRQLSECLVSTGRDLTSYCCSRLLFVSFSPIVPGHPFSFSLWSEAQRCHSSGVICNFVVFTDTFCFSLSAIESVGTVSYL